MGLSGSALCSDIYIVTVLGTDFLFYLPSGSAASGWLGGAV